MPVPIIVHNYIVIWLDQRIVNYFSSCNDRVTLYVLLAQICCWQKVVHVHLISSILYVASYHHLNLTEWATNGVRSWSVNINVTHHYDSKYSKHLRCKPYMIGTPCICSTCIHKSHNFSSFTVPTVKLLVTPT